MPTCQIKPPNNQCRFSTLQFCCPIAPWAAYSPFLSCVLLYINIMVMSEGRESDLSAAKQKGVTYQYVPPIPNQPTTNITSLAECGLKHKMQRSIKGGHKRFGELWLALDCALCYGSDHVATIHQIGSCQSKRTKKCENKMKTIQATE